MGHVERFEGERAQIYERRIGKMIPFYDGIMELVATELLAITPESGNILSVGCGTGGDFKNLLKIAPERFSITGIDPSPEMIEQAIRKYDKIHFECKTVDQLPLEPKFHSATLLLVLHFLNDEGEKLSLLKEIYDRLQPGGNLILFDLFKSMPEEDDTLYSYVKSYLLNFKGWEEEALNQYLKRFYELHRIPESRYLELFKEAGFFKVQRKFQAFHVGGWMATKKA
ncbi:class I SAM-dependent methyltransferase [Leptospira semungkisensis]|uniref:Class I SAM-dependent methyltransferase n=2 Tax=Leptospira semungkisensis TaxID=2484985 RepID=A0A4V3JCZ4_9LEPT|nr:class I SAM-dependent methyltransferase [Leptospira semungkisensis]TGK07979.1 class I SAM-dependent methyltransferase [Leptospira semungkisensis]